MALVVILLIFAYARLRIATFPLERDEGEYAYAGQLLLQGIPPYKLAYNMKLPGTYACYAGVMAVFGQSPMAVHIGLLIANSISIILLFFIAKRLLTAPLGVVAAATYAIMSTSHTVMGTAAHATQFVVMFALAGILALQKALASGRHVHLFGVGMLFGLAFLMKQPGLLFALFGAILVLRDETETLSANWNRCIKRQVILVLGVLTPFILTCGALYAAGVFQTFWFWTFTYTRTYGNEVSLHNGLLLLRDYFTEQAGPLLPLWMLCFIGLVSSLIRPAFRGKAIFVGGLLLLSALAVSAGLYFRPHYFVMMLPAVALCVALFVGAGYDAFAKISRMQWLRVLPAICFIGVWTMTFYFHMPLFFTTNTQDAFYFLYPGNPFDEAKAVGDYIRGNSSPTDTVAVLGSEPEIYFYSQRHSATGYIYTYPLMEKHAYVQKMHGEMISEITAASPTFLVFVGVPFSWGRQPDSDQTILRWFDSYTHQNYDLVQTMPVREMDPEPGMSEPKGKILIYKRKRIG